MFYIVEIRHTCTIYYRLKLVGNQQWIIKDIYFSLTQVLFFVTKNTFNKKNTNIVLVKIFTVKWVITDKMSFWCFKFCIVNETFWFYSWFSFWNCHIDIIICQLIICQQTTRWVEKIIYYLSLLSVALLIHYKIPFEIGGWHIVSIQNYYLFATIMNNEYNRIKN